MIEAGSLKNGKAEVSGSLFADFIVNAGGTEYNLSDPTQLRAFSDKGLTIGNTHQILIVSTFMPRRF